MPDAVAIQSNGVRERGGITQSSTYHEVIVDDIKFSNDCDDLSRESGFGVGFELEFYGGRCDDR